MPCGRIFLRRRSHRRGAPHPLKIARAHKDANLHSNWKCSTGTTVLVNQLSVMPFLVGRQHKGRYPRHSCICRAKIWSGASKKGLPLANCAPASIAVCTYIFNSNLKKTGLGKASLPLTIHLEVPFCGVIPAVSLQDDPIVLKEPCK